MLTSVQKTALLILSETSEEGLKAKDFGHRFFNDLNNTSIRRADRVVWLQAGRWLKKFRDADLVRRRYSGTNWVLTGFGWRQLRRSLEDDDRVFLFRNLETKEETELNGVDVDYHENSAIREAGKLEVGKTKSVLLQTFYGRTDRLEITRKA